MNCSYERRAETVSERSSLLVASTTNQSSSIVSRAVMCILFTELCIELTFLGVVGNLQLFATDENELNLSPQMASTITYIFQGTCCLLPVFGGWLADSVAGKFSVIFYSVIIYAVGTLLLLLGSISENDKYVEWAKTSLTTNKSFKRVNFLCGLALVTLATGGIKSNLVPLGAEQVSKSKKGGYFFSFYWFINIGAILAYTFVVYVQQSVSYFYGYLIPTCSIVIALIIFLSGKSSYFIRPPAASVLTRTLKVLMEAARKRLRPSQTSASVHWLDRAKQRFGGSYECCDVEDVKNVYRLIPIFTTFILFWMVCGQDSTAMIYQGKYMDISLTSDFQIPISSLSVFITIAVLMWIPILNKIVHPFLAKCNIRLDKLQRIGIGMAITTLSMVCAGGIEMLRVDQCCMEQLRPTDYNATIVSNITIFYQVPQYALIGLAYVFTSLTGLELAYAEAPPSLQGVVIGVFLLTASLGYYLGAGVMAVVNAISGAHSSADKWYPDKDNINEGKLAYYFFLLAGLMFLNFVLYIFVALHFKASKAASLWDSESIHLNSPSSGDLLRGTSDSNVAIGSQF